MQFPAESSRDLPGGSRGNCVAITPAGVGLGYKKARPGFSLALLFESQSFKMFSNLSISWSILFVMKTMIKTSVIIAAKAKVVMPTIAA